MHVVPCAAPSGTIEPAPLTSLPFHAEPEHCEVAAYWSDDDEYYLRAGSGCEDSRWFRIDAGTGAESGTDVTDEGSRFTLGTLLASVHPIGGGRVPFPVGSTGRTVFRVWRGRNGDGTGRTRILAVRAGRSRRLPA
jgi:hypothetical protein